MEQKLWATDLNLSYDDSLAMYQMLQYVTHGTLDIGTHFFDVPPPKREEKRSRRRRQQEDEVWKPHTFQCVDHFLFKLSEQNINFPYLKKTTCSLVD